MVLKCQSGLTQSKEKAWLRSGLGERQVEKQLADVQVGLEIWHLVVCGPNSYVYVTINVHLIANNHLPSVEVVEHHLCFYIFHRLIKITFIFVISQLQLHIAHHVFVFCSLLKKTNYKRCCFHGYHFTSGSFFKKKFCFYLVANRHTMASGSVTACVSHRGFPLCRESTYSEESAILELSLNIYRLSSYQTSFS